MIHWHNENVRKMTIKHLQDIGIDVNNREPFYSFVVGDILIAICTVKTAVLGEIDAVIMEKFEKSYDKFRITMQELSESPSYVSLFIQGMKENKEFFDWMEKNKNRRIEFLT